MELLVSELDKKVESGGDSASERWYSSICVMQHSFWNIKYFFCVLPIGYMYDVGRIMVTVEEQLETISKNYT